MIVFPLKLNGNFPALASPLPSFPTLYQSQIQVQGGKPSLVSTKPLVMSHPVGWGKSAPLKSTNKERESEEVKAPSSPLTPIASASTPPKSQKNAKKPKVNLLSTARYVFTPSHTTARLTFLCKVQGTIAVEKRSIRSSIKRSRHTLN